MCNQNAAHWLVGVLLAGFFQHSEADISLVGKVTSDFMFNVQFVRTAMAELGSQETLRLGIARTLADTVTRSAAHNEELRISNMKMVRA